jgi:hypothetical protein
MDYPNKKSERTNVNVFAVRIPSHFYVLDIKLEIEFNLF